MNTQHHTEAVAQLLRAINCRSEWRVTLADGRVYLANTYPDSALIFVTTTDGRPVRGVKMDAECRAAIAKAGALQAGAKGM